MTLHSLPFSLASTLAAARPGRAHQAFLKQGASGDVQRSCCIGKGEQGRTFHPREAWRAHARRETPVSLRRKAMPPNQARRDGAISKRQS